MVHPHADGCVESRLLRHFNVFYQDDIPARTIKNIFTRILSEAWKHALPGLCDYATDTIEATVTAYERIRTHLLPTPQKCHYTFTIRDISRAVEVMLMADTRKLTTKIGVAR